MSEATLYHPGDEALRALSQGQLTEAELAHVSAHLAECPDCCRRIDQVDTDDPLLALVQKGDASREKALVSPAQRRWAVRALRQSHEARSDTHPPPHSTLHPVILSAPRQVGDYEILAEVGRGGMGVVYKARHRGLNRLAALKMVLAGEFASATQELRFRLEAELAARVQHPNIVQVYEIGSYEGRPFLALEWVEGGSLANRLDGKPWPTGEAAALIETLARAIDVAHGEGVVHRDLKPANILIQDSGGRRQESATEERTAVPSDSCRLTPDSCPKITDFGLAQTTKAGQTMTQSGFLIGTPGYMAPEQASGKRALVGPATDIYALGVVLYQLLTGQLPFRADSTLELLRAVTSDEPTRLRRLQSRVPRDLEAITLRCLEKQPGQRYQSALALAEDLRRWQNNEPILAKPPSLFGRTVRWCRRNPAVTTVVVVMALGLAGVFGQWRVAVTAGKLAEDRRLIAEEAKSEAEKFGLDALAAKKEAEEEAAASREVANFLGGLFEEADPFILSERTFGEQPNTNPTAMEIVERGAKRLADPNFLKDKPLVRATLLDKVGHVFIIWGQVARAEPFVFEALELRKKQQDLPAVQADLATSLHNAGFLHHTKGNFRKSKELFAAAVELRSRLFGSRNALTMTSRFHLGHALGLLGQRTEAERLLIEVADFQRAQLKLAEEKKSTQIGKEALEYCATLLILAGSHGYNGDLVKSLRCYVELQQAAKQITNKQMGALILQFVNAKQLQALRQLPQADKEYRLLLEALEKAIGKRHYLYTLIDFEYANFLFVRELYEEAEKKFLDLETTYRSAFGGDALRLASISYDISRSIARGSLARTSRQSDPQRHKELSAKVVRYARAAYEQARKYDAEPEQMTILAIWFCHALIYHEPNPDYSMIEAIAREARGIREKLFGVGTNLDTHPLNYLLWALARQDKIEELERVFLDLLARKAQPKWDINACLALPEAAAKLARAGKIRTAVQMLEHAATTGHFDLNSVRTDAGFAALRESPDYQELLKKMKAPR
ncbi:MAG TPA: protein kinase [Gemmataceae bacterium]|jgi:serine/threonine protein kinase